ncbi:hypothetical protein [Natronohydrobacter thiooxidans]|uniref:hypothetical protein n=1 Tax=Natronohydrobacter thiooxidans TaxID=87172 RepID=UPI0008FF7046|nr:hypothetical protein [Natronohydrobacter thiooxidans]
MHILIAIMAAIGGVIWWWVRANPRDALSVADDAITVVRNAPRKIAFRRQTKEHPVEGIDDTRLAIASIALAFVHLDDLPTRDDLQRLTLVLRKTFKLSAEETEEMEVLGKWIQTQCGGASETISRVGRRLYKIDGSTSWGALSDVLQQLVGDELTPRQHDVLTDLRLALKIR